MPSVHPVSIAVASGTLAAVVHLPDRPPAAAVVCCHGLLSSKDSEKYVAIGEAFSAAGLAVVRFDFGGCGESRVQLTKDFLDSRLDDTRAVLRYVREQPWSDGTLALLGSSMGGFIALLTAAESPVRAVVCWATPFDLQRVNGNLEEIEAVRKLFPPGCGLGSPESLVKLPPIPRVLILHGQQDEVVPWDQAHELYRQLGEPRRLMLLERVDHRFSDAKARRLAIQASLEWVKGAL